MIASDRIKHPALSPEFLKTLSRQSGVYLMRDGKEEILYVGKAANLRKRVASYTRQVGLASSKTGVMLSKMRRVETILTNTEKEALILEAALIKKHKPRYNVILRDDKNYPYLKVTVKECWPRLLMARQRQKDGSVYFGPFSSVAAMWETFNYLHDLFPLRRCRGKEVKARPRPCLNYQLGQCQAPCAGLAEPTPYREMVRHVLMALEGKNRQLLATLKGEMELAAAALKFEEAVKYRDRIAALRKTVERQVIVASHNRDQDVFGFCRQGAAVAISVIHVQQGLVNGQQTFFFPEPLGRDEQILAEMVTSYYAEERPRPREILLPFPLADAELIVEWLNDAAVAPLVCRVPRRGGQADLLRMAQVNAQQLFAAQEEKEKSWQTLATKMMRELRLRQLPERIECLDISNLGGAQAVGSLVCYRRGEPDKSQYRHYRINSVLGPDDYASMAEVLGRRLAKAVEGELPDLLMVDGGKGQLQVAIRVVAELGLSEQLDLLGIAKARQGEGEKLYRPGRKNPHLLPGHSPLLLLCMRIRDEAHRFGITFHRQWRSRDTLQSALAHIPGIGAERQEALLTTLGSLRRISTASVAELRTVAGIGPELAEEIWRHFHPL